MYLIEMGAKINARDIDQDTPLHIACDKNNIELAKKLIEKGAAKIESISNNECEKKLQTSASGGNKKIKTRRIYKRKSKITKSKR